MAKPQIVVVGLGAVGSAALCHLARRGIPALGIEQFDLGHDRGSSHGPTRIIRLAHFEKPAYVPLMRRAYALWRELEALADVELLHITGLLETGPAHGNVVGGTKAAAHRHDIAVEELDAGEVMRRYPAFRLPDDFVGLLQADGGFIAADKAIAASLRIAIKFDARIRTNETVVEVKANGTGVRVRTSRETIDADGAIIAAGPWLRRLLPDLTLPLRVTRQVVGWFEPQDAALFAADRFPVFILQSRYGTHYGLPAYAGLGVKIAKHGHLEEEVEPDGYATTVSTADEAAIRAPLQDYLPGANGRLLSAQTCLYTSPFDDEFIIDGVAGCPQITIASPCCGRGFKFSVVVGEILADLVSGRSPGHDISPFRLQRFRQSRAGNL